MRKPKFIEEILEEKDGLVLFKRTNPNRKQNKTGYFMSFKGMHMNLGTEEKQAKLSYNAAKKLIKKCDGCSKCSYGDK